MKPSLMNAVKRSTACLVILFVILSANLAHAWLFGDVFRKAHDFFTSNIVCALRGEEEDFSGQTGLYENDQPDPEFAAPFAPFTFEEEDDRAVGKAVGGSVRKAERFSGCKQPPEITRIGTDLVLAYPPPGLCSTEQYSGSGYFRLALQQQPVDNFIGGEGTASLTIEYPQRNPPLNKVSFSYRPSFLYISTLQKPEPIVGDSNNVVLVFKMIVNGQEIFQTPLEASGCTPHSYSGTYYFYELNGQRYDFTPRLWICNYNSADIELPPTPEGDVSFEWSLHIGPFYFTSNSDFEMATGSNRSVSPPINNKPCYVDTGNADCTDQFTPTAWLSIDDISFQQREEIGSQIKCDGYEIELGKTIKCRVDAASAPATAYSVTFRISRDGNVVDEIQSERAPLNYKPSDKGLYTVDAYLMDGQRYVEKTNNMASVWVRGAGSSRPFAARLTGNKAIVFPPNDVCFTAGATQYEIYRSPYGEEASEEGGNIGSIDAALMANQGFVDANVSGGANLCYSIKPVYGGRTGTRSQWACTKYFSGNITFDWDHLPQPGLPTKFAITWYGEQSGGASFVIPEPPNFRIVGADPSQQVGFLEESTFQRDMSGLPTIYSTSEAFAAPALQAQSNRPSGWLTLIDKRAYNSEAGGYPELVDYTGQPPMQRVWVLAGDLAQPQFTDQQILAAISQLGPAASNFELGQCTFTLDSYRCTSPGPAMTMQVAIPVIDQNLFGSFTKFFFNSEITDTGMLLSPAWRSWVDQNRPTIFPGSQAESSLADINTGDFNQILPFAYGLATELGIKAIMSDESGEFNLFGLNTSIYFDWVPMYEFHIVGRYITPFLNSQAQVLSEGESQVIVRAHYSILDHFLNPWLHDDYNERLADAAQSVISQGSFDGLVDAEGLNDAERAYWEIFYRAGANRPAAKIDTIAGVASEGMPRAGSLPRKFTFVIGKGKLGWLNEFQRTAKHLQSIASTKVPAQDATIVTVETGKQLLELFKNLQRDRKNIVVIIAHMGSGYIDKKTGIPVPAGIFLKENNGFYLTDYDGAEDHAAFIDQLASADLTEGHISVILMGCNSGALSGVAATNLALKFVHYGAELATGTMSNADFYKIGGEEPVIIRDQDEARQTTGPLILLPDEVVVYKRQAFDPYRALMMGGFAAEEAPEFFETPKVVYAYYLDILGGRVQ